MPVSVQVVAIVVPLFTSVANNPLSLRRLAELSSKPSLSPLFLIAACLLGFCQPVALGGSAVNVAVNVAVGMGVEVEVGGKGVFVEV